MRNGKIWLLAIPMLLCAIAQPARAGTTGTVTYVFTQNLPTLFGTDSPTFTWTTGPLSGYVADWTFLPFLSGPVINADASQDGYSVADLPEVEYQVGNFHGVYLSYYLSGVEYRNNGPVSCYAGSDDKTSCTFSKATSYGLSEEDPPGFAPDSLLITTGSSGVPEPSSAVLALLGGLGVLLACRRRSH